MSAARRSEELTFAPDGGVSICGGFSPFGVDSVLPECADYIAVDAGIDADVRQMIAETTARGAPLTLPAGDLRMAVGLQYRSDKYQYRADEALRMKSADGLPDIITGFEAAADIDADDHNTDVYVEAAIPLLADLPGVEITRNRARIPPFGLRVRRQAWTRGRPSCCISPRRPCACAGPTSARSASRRSSSCSCQATPGEWFVFRPEPCSHRQLPARRSGPARVEALCIAQGVPAELLPDFLGKTGS